MNAIIKEIDFNNVIYTSFWDDKINANVNELIQILGIEPIRDFDVKTKFQWNLEYHSEILNKTFPFTLYDYDENWKSYTESATGVNDYLYTTKINWHIGGKTADDTILVWFDLENRLKKFRNENN